MRRIGMKKNGINYLIDKKMVALDIIMLLEGDYYKELPFLKAEEYSYLDEVREYFKEYVHHEAVEFFHKSWEEYAYETAYLKAMMDESDKIGKIVAVFMQESTFSMFFEEHLQYFETVLEKNLDQMIDIDMINAFNKTYGETSGEIDVYFSFVSGGVGYNINRTPNNKIILGVHSFENGLPIFLDNTHFLNMIFHECSHGYINPIVEKLPIDNVTIEYYFQKMHPQMQKMYGACKSMIAEQFVRGFTLHFLEEVNQEMYENQKEKEKLFGMELALEISEDLAHQNYLSFSDYIKATVTRISRKRYRNL